MMADESSSSTTGPLGCEEDDGEISEVCEDADPLAPYCLAGACVGCEGGGGTTFCTGVDPLTPACDTDTQLCEPCVDAETPVCEGSTPVCDATGECVACTAHSECSGSGACHLDASDPLQGACFAEDEVIWVDVDNTCPGDGSESDPFCDLANTLFNVADDTNVVVMIDAGNYDEIVTSTADSAVALIGVNGPIFGGVTGLAAASLAVTNGIVYVHGIGFAGNAETHGLRCDGATVWLQRSAFSNNDDYGIFTSGPCDMVLQESSVFGNVGGGVRALGGTLRIDNSAIGVNGNGARGPGLNLQFVDVDIIYSTIVGNDAPGFDSMQCVDATGAMRNSIVVGQSLSSVALDCFRSSTTTTRSTRPASRAPKGRSSRRPTTRTGSKTTRRATSVSPPRR